ncbi:uncharacterized protein LOC142322978 [Lycorma delicatula]|uniref:uncharacterized protein LOC142322978 n=1 Tax=Lycorma delicatula TaxID=130591 RepID=UPI003F514074
MSAVGRNYLRFGAADSSRCTILVISSTDSSVKKLMNSLLEMNKELYSDIFQINIVSSIASFLMLSKVGNVDYVVFLVDPCRSNWYAEVEENISMLDSIYLCGRCCLIIDSSNIANASFDVAQVNDLKRKYSVPALYGEIDRIDIVTELSHRILRLVSFVCCNSSSLPLITEFISSI